VGVRSGQTEEMGLVISSSKAFICCSGRSFDLVARVMAIALVFARIAGMIIGSYCFQRLSNIKYYCSICSKSEYFSGLDFG
jgi:hypothetical protein